MYRYNMATWLLSCLFVTSASIAAQPAGRERIGLVLAGGGARGLAHAGVIRALAGNRPKCI